LRALGLRRGAVVAVPALSCGSEIEGLMQAGFLPRAFGVVTTLDPEPLSFVRALDGAAAAVVMHYFGFPADLTAATAACQGGRLPLIEDWAQAPYATTVDTGDGAISGRGPWHAVSLPREGAILLHDALEDNELTLPNVSQSIALRHAHRVVNHRLQGLASAGARIVYTSGSLAVGLLPPNRQPAPIEVRWRDGVRQRRRDHYEQMLNGLAGLPGVRPLFAHVPADACPLLLPILVDRPASLCHALAARGVAIRPVWPWFHSSVPWQRFPYETRLKRGTVGLPVDPALRPADLARTVDAIRRWSRS
jgi:dTDP-4-amino-4,6-dideoxygalactose transaminase